MKNTIKGCFIGLVSALFFCTQINAQSGSYQLPLYGLSPAPDSGYVILSQYYKGIPGLATWIPATTFINRYGGGGGGAPNGIFDVVNNGDTVQVDTAYMRGGAPIRFLRDDGTGRNTAIGGGGIYTKILNGQNTDIDYGINATGDLQLYHYRNSSLSNSAIEFFRGGWSGVGGSRTVTPNNTYVGGIWYSPIDNAGGLSLRYMLKKGLFWEDNVNNYGRFKWEFAANGNTNFDGELFSISNNAANVSPYRFNKMGSATFTGASNTVGAFDANGYLNNNAPQWFFNSSIAQNLLWVNSTGTGFGSYAILNANSINVGDPVGSFSFGINQGPTGGINATRTAGGIEMSFNTGPNPAIDIGMIIDDASSIQFPEYGGGGKTGTATYFLAVDAAGNVIETPGGGGSDGNGFYDITNNNQLLGSGIRGTVQGSWGIRDGSGDVFVVDDTNNRIAVRDGKSVDIENSATSTTQGTERLTVRANTNTFQPIARFIGSETEDTSSYYLFLESANGGNTEFLRGGSATTSTGHGDVFQITETHNDGSVNPVMQYTARVGGVDAGYNSITQGSISDRPLFAWLNYNNRVMQINANGNVGIGTTTPARRLHVSDAEAPVRFESTDTGGSDHWLEMVNQSTNALSSNVIRFFKGGTSTPTSIASIGIPKNVADSTLAIGLSNDTGSDNAHGYLFSMKEGFGAQFEPYSTLAHGGPVSTGKAATSYPAFDEDGRLISSLDPYGTIYVADGSITDALRKVNTSNSHLIFQDDGLGNAGHVSITSARQNGMFSLGYTGLTDTLVWKQDYGFGSDIGLFYEGATHGLRNVYTATGLQFGMGSGFDQFFYQFNLTESTETAPRMFVWNTNDEMSFLDFSDMKQSFSIAGDGLGSADYELRLSDAAAVPVRLAHFDPADANNAAEVILDFDGNLQIRSGDGQDIAFEGDSQIQLNADSVRINNLGTQATAQDFTYDLVASSNGHVRPTPKGTGIASASTDGSGDLTINHSFGNTDFTVTATPEGTTPYFLTVHTKTATTFKIRVFNTAGVAVTSTAVDIAYNAKR